MGVRGCQAGVYGITLQVLMLCIWGRLICVTLGQLRMPVCVTCVPDCKLRSADAFHACFECVPLVHDLKSLPGVCNVSPLPLF